MTTSEFRTLASMTAPNSVKAKSNFLGPPQLEAICSNYKFPNALRQLNRVGFENLPGMAPPKDNGQGGISYDLYLLKGN